MPKCSCKTLASGMPTSQFSAPHFWLIGFCLHCGQTRSPTASRLTSLANYPNLTIEHDATSLTILSTDTLVENAYLFVSSDVVAASNDFWSLVSLFSARVNEQYADDLLFATRPRLPTATAAAGVQIVPPRFCLRATPDSLDWNHRVTSHLAGSLENCRLSEVQASLVEAFRNDTREITASSTFGLSGGMDSRVLGVARSLAPRANHNAKVYVISGEFPGLRTSRTLRSARSLAQYLGIELSEVDFRDGSITERIARDIFVAPRSPSQIEKNAPVLLNADSCWTGASSYRVTSEANDWVPFLYGEDEDFLSQYTYRRLMRLPAAIDRLQSWSPKDYASSIAEDLRSRLSTDSRRVDAIRLFHADVLNLGGANGAFEGRGEFVPSRFLWGAQITAVASRWPQELFLDRFSHRLLLSALAPDLLRIPDQDGYLYAPIPRSQLQSPVYEYSTMTRQRVMSHIKRQMPHHRASSIDLARRAITFAMRTTLRGPTGIDYPLWWQTAFLRTAEQTIAATLNNLSPSRAQRYQEAIAELNAAGGRVLLRQRFDMLKHSLVCAMIETGTHTEEALATGIALK